MALKPSTEEKGLKKNGYRISVKGAKVAGILGLVIVVVAIFLMSPLFAIESIEVDINNSEKKNEVLSCLGFKTGDNIFSVDVKKAKENVEKLDRVDYCEIDRDIFGNVTVTVEEKTELGYIQVAAGYAGIDEYGKVMKISKTREMNIPVISGIKIAEPKKNDYIKSEDRKGKQKTELITRILFSLKEHGLLEVVETIDVVSLRNVSMMLEKDTLVSLGEDGTENKDRAEYKIATLRAILAESEYSAGGEIDLSNTDNMISTMSR